MKELRRLFQPDSIAIIGGKWAEEAIRQCLKFGYEGTIWPVHPRHKIIQGLNVYPSIADLPGPPDAAFIGVNREITIEIVAQLAKYHCGGAVCFSSGFGETLNEDDTLGAGLERALLEASGDMPVLGPNCYGYINYCDAVLLWPDQHGGQKLPPGTQGAAIISQSSNVAINISMQKRGLPLAYLITVGNQTRLGLSQIGLALLDDPRVSCLGLYVEGFDSIENMQLLARKAYALKKPIAILKIGKSEQAQKGALSHTASFAGSHNNTSVFIKRMGMAQVDSIPALLDALMMMHAHGALPGFRLTAMVSSGGEASLMADLARDKTIEFPPLPPASEQKTQDALGPLVAVANPLDFHTYIWGNRKATAQAFAGMMSAGFDLNIVMLDFPAAPLDDSGWQVTAEAFLDAKYALAREHGRALKTALVSCLAENAPNATLSAGYLARGMPCFGGLDEILKAAEAAAGIGKRWREWNKDGLPMQLCNNTINLEQSTEILNEFQAKTLLAEYGISIPSNKRIIPSEDITIAARSLGYPLAIKALGIAHKTELNAVRLDISCRAELLSNASELRSLSTDILLERMVEKPLGELLLGISRDAQFGLVLTIAMGGILVELWKESISILLPSNENEIRAALLSLKFAPLFESYREQAAWDLEAIVNTALAVQAFALDYQDRLIELDINPLIISEQDPAGGNNAIAADALIILTTEK